MCRISSVILTASIDNLCILYKIIPNDIYVDYFGLFFHENKLNELV
jgi:hypothetical protein